MAGAMTLGACLGAGGAGHRRARRRRRGDGGRHRRHASRRTASLADAGWTIQCALFPGLAAMSMVLLARLDQGSAIALLLLVSAYETGRLHRRLRAPGTPTRARPRG